MRTLMQLQETYGGDAVDAVSRAIRAELTDGAWVLDALVYSRGLRGRCIDQGLETEDVDTIIVGLIGLTRQLVDSLLAESVD